MTTDEYKRRVIDLFKSGRATDEQWEAFATILDKGSGDAETDWCEKSMKIDLDPSIAGPVKKCDKCGEMYLSQFGCWECDDDEEVMRVPTKEMR